MPANNQNRPRQSSRNTQTGFTPVRARGVRGAAGACAIAAITYLFSRSALYMLANFFMNLAVPGASLSTPIGFSGITVALIQFATGGIAMALPLVLLLGNTRLNPDDLRITIPAGWSPLFCLIVFLGVTNAGNLLGGLFANLTGYESTSSLLPSGGPELVVDFLLLCILPAVGEELLFRGALQGILRPCGSAAAIFGTALLFALLHLDPIQAITAFGAALFLGWLAERSGSILPCMLLHLANNTLAFLNLYLHQYAPTEPALAVHLFILLFFPFFAIAMLLQARQQGFRFSAGLRPGVEPFSVFSSPGYTITVVFLAALPFLTRV